MLVTTTGNIWNQIDPSSQKDYFTIFDNDDDDNEYYYSRFCINMESSRNDRPILPCNISTPIPGGADMLFLIVGENVFNIKANALHPTDIENNRIAIIQFGGNCHHFAQIQYETVGANRTSTVPIYSTIDFKISNE
ncbi:hypothetical protein DERP_007645 [Dermatophagoides pteronyssinus]|uniref:Uncharacterized protein n=1 Tax=Dermatophagoides pteronyssinus TaxID=6956 RepID=A0ABQ8JKB7_DERPT|nr:hypothetical protein DERP_007645 [Dermatophagoides pteronyssinus]